MYNHFTIILHRKCTASCDLCCVQSKPSCQESLDIDRVKDYISSSIYCESIKSIGISGGEPFLEYDKVKELITLIKNTGKKASLMTNAYWATSYVEAYDKLTELKKCGLSSIGLSYDYFHSPYIKSENVSNVLLAANDMELNAGLNIVISKSHLAGEAIDSLGAATKEAQIMIFPCQKVGNAAINFDDTEYLRTRKSAGCYCKKGRGYSVTYDGTILPCCSPSVFSTALSIGNYEDLDVTSTLDKLKRNPYLYLLRTYGFDYFIDIARNKLDIEVPEYVVSACELCALFFNEKNIKKFDSYIDLDFVKFHGRFKEKSLMRF